MIPDVATDYHVEVMVLLSDAIIHETRADVIKPFLRADFPEEKLDEYLRYGRPSENPAFKQGLKDVVNRSPTSTAQQFVILTNVLDSRILSPLLTGTTKLIREMTLEEREALIKSWRDSFILAKRKLYRSVHALTISCFVRFSSELHHLAVDFPEREVSESLNDGLVGDTFKYSILDRPLVQDWVLEDIDVVIIGSGSGAGVVAHTLASEGYKSLVLEKGKYYSNDELSFNDDEGYKNLYENGGTVVSSNTQITVLAGSTFGGGSTVNWSACLKTTFKVRKEWYDEFGIDWIATEDYDNCMDYVFDKMGASVDGIEHSLANQVVIDGAEKCGYKHKTIHQNTGNQKHDCGLCYKGCKSGIKQGSANCWFRDAANKGTQFLDQVVVLKLLHRNGKAVGVLCEDKVTGKKFKISGAKKYVVSGGSLNTPVILQNSGFKNKHIGSNLKLHPVTAMLGDFGRDVKSDPFIKPIMTSVCTERDDLDGKAHGAKVETLLATPYIESIFYPWNGSDGLRQDLLRYQLIAPMLIITRDKSSGTVRADPKKPGSIIIDYEVNVFDRNALLQTSLIAADLLYIEGAKEIIGPQFKSPRFKSDKPKEQRTLQDKDYVAWRKKFESIPFDFYATAYGSAHQMSTCRISGKGPSQGALDQHGRLYECKNVYVADASVMPTASGVNPMVTTMAFARHIALDIVKDLKQTSKL